MHVKCFIRVFPDLTIKLDIRDEKLDVVIWRELIKSIDDFLDFLAIKGPSLLVEPLQILRRI